ncbi:hypothetical protein B0H19DRAFT_1083575 [Mycena capillaripes]|nr:hypothetical protein B0H19DRAFT_1083575 [Mycena capillaripes]
MPSLRSGGEEGSVIPMLDALQEKRERRSEAIRAETIGVGKKEGQGKGKATAGMSPDEHPNLPNTNPEPTFHHERATGAVDNNDNDPFLTADLALATAASLGLTTVLDQASGGASSSRRPTVAAGSPAKRVRSNTAGDAAPSCFTTGSSSLPTPNRTSPFLAPVAATAATPPPAAGCQPPAAVATGTIPAVPHVVAVAAPTVAPLYAAVAAAPPTAAAIAAGPVWLTDDNNPPRGSYTPTPAGGYPEIIYSPTLLRRGIPETLLTLYASVPEPKFFMVVSGGNGQIMRTHAHIREAVGNYININVTDFQLGTPPTVESGPSPNLWLVAGIRPHLAQEILSKPVMSSTRITIYPIPYNMPVNGFIGTYGGLTLPDTDDTGALYLFQAAARGNGDISQFVQTHRDAFGPQVSAEESFDTFIASMRVRALRLTTNDVDTVTWQLHVTSPTNDHSAWDQLCRLFSRIKIMTALYGTAYLLRPFHCHICPSVTHPTDLCPLPAVPGWLGPTPTTIKALEDASHQAAIKARENMCNNSAPADSGSNPRPNTNRGHGPAHGNKKPRKDGKGKGGSAHKGKGKRHDDWY